MTDRLTWPSDHTISSRQARGHEEKEVSHYLDSQGDSFAQRRTNLFLERIPEGETSITGFAKANEASLLLDALMRCATHFQAEHKPKQSLPGIALHTQGNSISQRNGYGINRAENCRENMVRKVCHSALPPRLGPLLSHQSPCPAMLEVPRR